MAKFYVCWADRSFPEIRVWTEGSDETPKTLAECKRDIRASAQSVIQHWRAILADLSSTKAADVVEREGA